MYYYDTQMLGETQKQERNSRGNKKKTGKKSFTKYTTTHDTKTKKKERI